MATYTNYLNHQALLAPLTPYEELANRAYADLGMQVPFAANLPISPAAGSPQTIRAGLAGYGMSNQQLPAQSPLGQVALNSPTAYENLMSRAYASIGLENPMASHLPVVLPALGGQPALGSGTAPAPYAPALRPPL